MMGWTDPSFETDVETEPTDGPNGSTNRHTAVAARPLQDTTDTVTDVVGGLLGG
jgi:hypothetical protein